MTTFQKTHHAQNQLNLDLLNFVSERGQANWQELFAAFGDGEACSTIDTHRFGKKLEYLIYTGRLLCTGRGITRVFTISPEADQPVPGRGLTTARASQVSGSDVPVPTEPVYVGQRVPPRQFNTMAADPYVPPVHTAMRPGALDFKRYRMADRC